MVSRRRFGRMPVLVGAIAAHIRVRNFSHASFRHCANNHTRLAPPANYQMELGHDVKISERKKDENCCVRRTPIADKDADLSLLVQGNDDDAGWPSYFEHCSGAPMTSDNQAVGCADHTAIILEFL